MQMKAPVLMDAQVAREAAPPPLQSAQERFSGRSSSGFERGQLLLVVLHAHAFHLPGAPEVTWPLSNLKLPHDRQNLRERAVPVLKTCAI